MNEKYIAAPDPFELKWIVERRKGWKPVAPMELVPPEKQLEFVGTMPDQYLPRYMQQVRRKTA
jgi:hypothetical protein